MIGASMTNSVRARAALAIVRLMDELAFDPDQLRDRRGRWVKDPRSGARPSMGGGAGAGGSSAGERPSASPAPVQAVPSAPTRAPATPRTDMRPRTETYKGRKLRVVKHPTRKGYLQTSINGEPVYTPIGMRPQDMDRELEQLRRDVDGADQRRAEGDTSAFPAAWYEGAPEPHPVDERAELRAIQLAEIDRDVAAGRRRDPEQTRIDRAEIAIRRHADAVKMHDNDPSDERWTAELREAEADLTAQGVKVESYGYTQPGHDGGTARYNAMGQLDARAGREAELDAEATRLDRLIDNATTMYGSDESRWPARARRDIARIRRQRAALS